MRILRSISAWLNPVLEELVPEPPTPSKPDLFPCANPRCCVLMAFGMLKCPRCGVDQSRVLSPAIALARHEQAVLDGLDPDNPYDWAVHGL